MANQQYGIPNGSAGKGIKEIEESLGMVTPQATNVPDQPHDEEEGEQA